MILCEKCNNFIFPEGDEDGIWSFGCRNPNVVDVFGNFCRRYRCKYYQKITYEKMLKETKRNLSRITNYSFYYRDPRIIPMKKQSILPTRKLNIFIIERIKIFKNDYIEYRDYLFNVLKKKKELLPIII